jgi:hypothetical protein
LSVDTRYAPVLTCEASLGGEMHNMIKLGAQSFPATDDTMIVKLGLMSTVLLNWN